MKLSSLYDLFPTQSTEFEHETQLTNLYPEKLALVTEVGNMIRVNPFQLDYRSFFISKMAKQHHPTWRIQVVTLRNLVCSTISNFLNKSFHITSAICTPYGVFTLTDPTPIAFPIPIPIKCRNWHIAQIPITTPIPIICGNLCLHVLNKALNSTCGFVIVFNLRRNVVNR